MSDMIELNALSQFWLAYLQHVGGAAWQPKDSMWNILLKLHLVRVDAETAKLNGMPNGQYYRYMITEKGEKLVPTFAPERVVSWALSAGMYDMATEWMQHVSPEYLPQFLTHSAELVRQVAAARMRFVEPHMESENN